MKEAKDVLRVVGVVLLALFVLAVGVPLVLTAAGVALGIVGFLVGLAVLLDQDSGRGCNNLSDRGRSSSGASKCSISPCNRTIRVVLSYST